MNDEIKKLYEKFQNIYVYIENELKENNQLPIDVMLLNMNPSDVLNIMSSYAPISFGILKQNEEMQKYFISYLYRKKEYFDNLSIPNEKLGLLLSKDGAGQTQHHKSESFYYNEANQEKYLNDILNRLIDCANLYYSLYHNNDINVQLGDGTKLSLQFLESNLLHVLGITQFQVNNNPELRKALNVPEWKNMGSMEILEKIIKDIQTNKDILCLQMKNNIKRIEKYGTSGEIVSTQLDPNTSSELLPYDKIDLKTRAFINSGPYNGVSVISGISDDQGFISSDRVDTSNPKRPQKPEDREIQQVRISKTDFDTLEKEKVTIETDDGQQINISRGDYIFNGYTKRPEDIRTLRSSQVGTSKRIIPNPDGSKRNNIGKFKAMFNGQTPIPVVGVENPDGTTLVFTPEQQQEMFMSLYFDFGGKGGMNFSSYLDILNEFAINFRNELEEQALIKTDSGIIIPTNNSMKK